MLVLGGDETFQFLESVNDNVQLSCALVFANHDESLTARGDIVVGCVATDEIDDEAPFER
jgi:hypothetical protein